MSPTATGLRSRAARFETARWSATAPFAPNDPITREQIAVILYRYAHEENTEDGKLTSFPDAKDISGYALEAMNWAVARGLINGSDGKLLPQDTATRAQIAVILARYLNA